MLSTAEVLLGLSRHLGTYALGPDRAALGALEFSGQVLELAVRLRKGGVARNRRVSAMALDAGITRRALVNEILPTLETLGWVEVARDHDNNVVSVIEHIPPLPLLMASADNILALAMPEPVERVVLMLLEETVKLPITRAQAIELGSQASNEEDAVRALDYLQALHLVALAETDDGHRVAYNPNIWSVDSRLLAAALRAEDSSVRAGLSGLLEEVADSPGLPETGVTSTSKQWIDYAVAHGIIQRSLVVTSDGKERAFLFAPHLGRTAFDAVTGIDPSGHVRQLIGSMIYAKTYADYRLRSPAVFLRRLIEWGEAGDASSIGTDYPMLETSGIVQVEPTDRYFKLVLLQSDIAEQAVEHLQSTGGSAEEDQTAAGLRDQRRYVHPERTRARQRVELARVADTTTAETRRLLGALRETTAGRRYE